MRLTESIGKRLALLTLLVGCSLAVAEGDLRPARHVLVLHSYTPDFPWTASIDAAIRERFAQADPTVTIHSEYMNTKVVAPEKLAEYSDQLAEAIALKFSHLKFSGIIVTDNNALNYILDRRDGLHDAPAVFCGINNLDESDLAGHRSRITGVVEQVHFADTLEMALGLHPDTRCLAVVSDQVVSGRMHLREITRLLEEQEARGMQIIRLVDLEADQLASRLSSLPDKTLVFYLSLFQTADGRRFDWTQGVRFIDRRCDHPIYSFWGFTIGNGAVGGVITSGQDQGSHAADRMLEILQGTAPEAIPIEWANPKRIVFDAEKLAEAGLSLEDLPAGARVINRRISFYQRYRSLIWTVVTIFAVLVVLLAAVSINVLHRRRAEKLLRTERNLLQNVLANIPHMVFWKDENLIYRGCNLNFARFAGFEQPEQLIGKSDTDLPIPPQRLARYQAQDRQVLRTGEPIIEQAERLHDSNGGRQLVITKVPLRSRQGRMDGVLCLCRDVTRQRMLEQQLQHAEKMEAIGQLAGGIAHDFNNLLAVVQGNVELMQMQTEEGHPNAPLAEEVLNATRRAAELTRQLLNFARRGEMKLDPVDVHVAVREVAGILSRSLIGQIEVCTDLQAETSVIQADESQLHNALLNLGLNARDAMADGGELTFRTRSVELSEKQVEQLSSSGISPGRYLQLEVADTGAGMDAQTVERAFEPFFTTKQMGHGTGLGLASVYGAVVAHRGHVQIESSPGQGTTICIWLPLETPEIHSEQETPDPVSVKPETD